MSGTELNVGDRVRTPGGNDGAVLAVGQNLAFVRWASGGTSAAPLNKLDKLVVAGDVSGWVPVAPREPAKAWNDSVDAVAKALDLPDDAAPFGVQKVPDDNPKTVLGLRKPPTHAIPPVALLHLGGAMADGEAKYGLMNWRQKRVSASVYYDAAMRHLLAWWDGEDSASDSGCHHLAHVMACMSILLDAEANKTLNDDRPTPGAAAGFVGNSVAMAG